MTMIIFRVVCLIIGYGFGLIQAGFLLGKIYNIDIRKEGSGNAGTTNAMRVLGVKVGLLTFLIDALKCVAAILLVRAFWGGNEAFILLALYTGLGVTLGHNFPFYMDFKGGKGIAAMSGLVIIIGVLTNPWIIIVPAFAFYSCAILTRYISLGSLQVSVLFIFMMMYSGQMGGFDELSGGNRIELYIIVFLLAALAWYRHLDNIKRLLKGEENRFGSKKEEEKQKNEVEEPSKLSNLESRRVQPTRFTPTYSRDFGRSLSEEVVKEKKIKEEMLKEEMLKEEKFKENMLKEKMVKEKVEEDSDNSKKLSTKERLEALKEKIRRQ
jgi:glycerol-3-phosphate acyltransferase PlsY